MDEGRAARAIVTGASRGVGRGVAEGLAEIGAAIVLAGRDARALRETAGQVEALGGRPHVVPGDLSDDVQIDALFGEADHRLGGPPDLLVNAAWGGYEAMVDAQGEFSWPRPFWEQSLAHWDRMFAAGVRVAYAASRHAAQRMVHAGSGLIVHLSYWAARKYMANTAYGVAKAATDRMAADMAHELRPHGVCVVALYPGLVRTERVLESADFLDLSNSESPRFSGRAIAALLRDPQRLEHTGQALVAAELAARYGFDDSDGRRPRALTLDEA